MSAYDLYCIDHILYNVQVYLLLICLSYAYLQMWQTRLFRAWEEWRITLNLFLIFVNVHHYVYYSCCFSGGQAVRSCSPAATEQRNSCCCCCSLGQQTAQPLQYIASTEQLLQSSLSIHSIQSSLDTPTSTLQSTVYPPKSIVQPIFVHTVYCTVCTK